MTLSVCCFTNVPGAVLAASIEPLRDVADEIVVAYDAGTDPGLIGPVMDLADRVFRVEVGPPYLERILGWMMAQCSGSWIFRIDGDEIPSAALVGALETLEDNNQAGQYLVPRRWLYPDAGNWITDDPWHPDYQIRITRNSAEYTEVEGVTHSSVRLADDHGRLAAPLYHTACLTTSVAERASKADGYEELRPGHRTAAGASMASFYLPEEATGLSMSPVEAEDLDRVRAVLAAQPVVTTPGPDIAVVALAEIDRHWPGRELAEDDYRSRLVVLEVPNQVTAGDPVDIVVEVTNTSPNTWHRASKVALGGRWVRDGSVRPGESRARLPAAVAAGETIVIPIRVDIAEDHDAGDALELDMVDEGVRWFGHGVELSFG